MDAIAQLHADTPRRHHEFPVTARGVFLAHAAVAPLTRAGAEEASRLALAQMHDDQERAVGHNAVLADVRQTTANYFHCGVEDVALVAPTSVALSLVAAGLPWQQGDNVVFSPDCYPSNAVPWMDLARRGVEPRAVVLRGGEAGQITPAAVAAAIDSRTRLVALASCHFVTGYQIDVAAIGAICREKGVLFCLDCIQTAGAFPTAAAWADFLCADAHKWMLGPCASGFLIVNARGREALYPSLLGWHNVHMADFCTPTEVKLRHDARRYEAGSANLLGMAAYGASLKVLASYGGPRVIGELLGAQAAWLRDRLRAAGWQLAHTDEANLSGITSFRRDGVDLAAIQRGLGERGITVSLRRLRDGRWFLRLSPHFYTTRAELEHALATVAELCP